MSTDQFPASGLSEDLLFQDMEAARKSDVDWRAGRLPGFYVHFASDEVDEIGRKALEMFHATNALGMAAFPSIRKFEAELVGWALDLFNAEDGCGSVTSGGTESIFLAVKTAREWARRHRPDVTAPKMVMPHSAHPAFDKAAKYLCMEPVRVPLQDDLRADVAAIKAEIDERTVFMMGSAPQFTFGLFDQIDELAAIADERNIWFHTDACVGGFLSPFAESLGYDIPPWDFRVRGVKSISADLHKYGFAPKGASIVAFADDEASVRPFQVFDFENWSRALRDSDFRWNEARRDHRRGLGGDAFSRARRLYEDRRRDHARKKQTARRHQGDPRARHLRRSPAFRDELYVHRARHAGHSRRHEHERLVHRRAVA